MIERPIKLTKKIPVFGDIHGNIEGLFNTVKYLQNKTGESFNYVLQLGDFGYYPNIANIPRNIRSPLELGVHNYLSDNTFARKLLSDSDLKFEIFFIRGNHEDHSELERKIRDQQNGTIIVDFNERILYFPDGRGISIQVNLEIDRIIGVFGGINPISRLGSYNRNPLIGFSKEAFNELVGFKKLDILLTHQGPDHTKKGNDEITALIELLQPKIHLHGHSHKISTNIPIGATMGYGLGKMPHSKRPYLTDRNFYRILDLEKLSLSMGSQLLEDHQVI